MESASTDPLEFWDSHFHIWDATEDAPLQSGIDAGLLAGATPGDDKNYRYAALAAELQSLNGHDLPLVYSGGCFIEAMSVCFPKKVSAHDLNPLCVQEARWAERELVLPPLEKSFFLCPSVQLQAKNAAATLAEVARCRNVRGVRQILNFRADDPKKCHPRNSEDFLADPAFRKNFGLLAKHDLHFEAQLEAPQFEAALELFREHPTVPIVLNHLGCPSLEELAPGSMFWKGMEGFAKEQRVVVKLSMLCRIHPNWDQNQAVVNAVHKIIELFGVERCFFASNFPVDSAMNWPATKLFAAFLKIAEKYTRDEQICLFSRSARVAYRALNFDSSNQAAQTLLKALSANDLHAAVACHSENVEVTVIHKTTGIRDVHRGHQGVYTFYRDVVFPAEGAKDVAWSIPNAGAKTIEKQAILILAPPDGAVHVVETNAFDDSGHIVSKTVIV